MFMLDRIAAVGCVVLLLSAAGCLVPEKCESSGWSGKTAGTAYLGDDVLWRPRENLLFHMKDELGSGFSLRFTVRDMNTYVHAPAPILFQVVGPDDRILVSARLEDDGITGGNFAHQDGIYDPFADFRYRQYHRANTPGGMPPGKSRSPYLRNPEKLPFRVVELDVPAGGKVLGEFEIMHRNDFLHVDEVFDAVAVIFFFHNGIIAHFAKNVNIFRDEKQAIFLLFLATNVPCLFFRVAVK